MSHSTSIIPLYYYTEHTLIDVNGYVPIIVLFCSYCILCQVSILHPIIHNLQKCNKIDGQRALSSLLCHIILWD